MSIGNIVKFDFPTAIIGIHDYESLKLVTVHFNGVDAEISQESEIKKYVDATQGKMDTDEFSIKSCHEYKDLFTGIGNMDTTIDIKLKEGAIPYVAPTCHMAHALQELIIVHGHVRIKSNKKVLSIISIGISGVR